VERVVENNYGSLFQIIKFPSPGVLTGLVSRRVWNYYLSDLVPFAVTGFRKKTCCIDILDKNIFFFHWINFTDRRMKG
jgi:hypothetical protein